MTEGGLAHCEGIRHRSAADMYSAPVCDDSIRLDPIVSNSGIILGQLTVEVRLTSNEQPCDHHFSLFWEK